VNDSISTDAASDIGSKTDGDQTYGPTILGWAARLLSLGLIAFLVGNILWQISLEDRDIGFTVAMERDEIRQQGDQYLVPLKITNDGSEAARTVTLEIITAEEIIDIEILLIGQNETVSYVIALSELPRSIEYRIISYETS